MGWRWLTLLPLCAGLGCVALPFQAGSTPSTVAEARTDLQEAASCLERGDTAGALPFLTRHVEAHPEQVNIRAHLAELLVRLDRKPEARRQFELYIREAQRQGSSGVSHLIQAHTRLAEIAQSANDPYREHLNRGIGLFLLAKQIRSQGEEAGAPNPERMLFKAAAELEEAMKLAPEAARPHWYAHEVWSELGQQRPAMRELRAARQRATLSDLTPAEASALTFADSLPLTGKRPQ